MQRRSPRQHLGDRAEQRALDHLMAQGLRLIGRNLSSPLGEIDLLLEDRGQWVFVEVRQRSSTQFGGAAASISFSKQQRLRRQALRILQQHFGARPWPAMRFDVIAIEGRVDDGRIDWIANAF